MKRTVCSVEPRDISCNTARLGKVFQRAKEHWPLRSKCTAYSIRKLKVIHDVHIFPPSVVRDAYVSFFVCRASAYGCGTRTPSEILQEFRKTSARWSRRVQFKQSFRVKYDSVVMLKTVILVGSCRAFIFTHIKRNGTFPLTAAGKNQTLYIQYLCEYL